MAEEERRTLIAFAVTAVFMVVEAAGGLVAGSLALLADAAHMLVDVLSLMMAWGAFRFGRLAADHRRSYGYRRLEVLAALANGVTILALSAGIVYEAALRLMAPAAVLGWPMLVVAAVGFAANIVTLRVLEHGHVGVHGALHRHEHDDHHHDHPTAKRGLANLNLQGAALHVLGDLLGSAAAIAAAAVILATGWTPIDPILSIAIALLIIGSGLKVIRQATHILLEGSPEDFDPVRLRRALVGQVAGLKEVHHLHAWSVSSGQHMLTLHAMVEGTADRDVVLAEVKQLLAGEFGYSHSVVQIEGEPCDDDQDGCA